MVDVRQLDGAHDGAGGVAAATDFPVRLRAVVDDDLAWGLALHRRRSHLNYDADTALTWVRNVVLRMPQNFRAMRTDDAFVVTMITALPWQPNALRAHVMILSAEEGKIWQVPPLLRDSVLWARRREAVSWSCQAAPGLNLWPLAKRMGANVIEPRYTLNL